MFLVCFLDEKTINMTEDRLPLFINEVTVDLETENKNMQEQDIIFDIQDKI